jgi:hypothetical protein
MNKAQFKKLYSEYRKNQFEFEVYMANRNVPCGYDDYLYEKHGNMVQEWLEKHPVIAQVTEMRYDTDYLKWRAENVKSNWWCPILLKRELQQKYKQVA